MDNRSSQRGPEGGAKGWIKGEDLSGCLPKGDDDNSPIV
jgi:hypothetical protein